MSDNKIEVDVSAAGKASIQEVNSALDDLHNRLANLGSGKAGSSVAALEAQVNELRGTMGSFRGVGASAVSELQNLRRQMADTLNALAEVMSNRNFKGNIAVQYIELGTALQSSFSNLDKVFTKGIETVKVANSAMADEIARNNRMVRKAIADAGQYSPYNARAVANFESNSQKGSAAEKQLGIDRTFAAEQQKMISDSVSAELRGYADIAAGHIKSREVQLGVDRVFAETEQKIIRDALTKELAGYADVAKASMVAREKQLGYDRTFLATQEKMLSDALTKELAGYAKAAEAAIATKAAAQAVISNFKISGLSPLKQIELDANDAHSAVRGLASGFNAMFLTWGNIAPLLAGAAISNAFVQALKVGAQVQDNLLSIEHLAGASTAEIKLLSAAILDLGASTQFGPVALSEALKTLSLAGLSAKDSLTALKPVLEFSVAGELPINKAAESLISISTAFGYSATGIATVGDTIAKAAAASMASVDGMTEAFRAGSVVAQQYNVSLNDAALNLSFLSQIGIKGSAAGTALKNMYTELLSGSNKTRKALEELGVQAIDNVNGTKPFIEIISQLDFALSKKTKTAQQSYLADAANNRGSKDIVAALQAYRNKVIELTGAEQAEIEVIRKSQGERAAHNKELEISATMYNKIQAALKDSAGFTAIANAEKSLGATNIFEGLKSSMQTDLLEAFNGIADIVTVVGKKLRDAFNSEEFRSGLDYLVLNVAKVTDVLVSNLPMLVKVGEAFVIYKAAAFAASAVMAGFAVAAAVGTQLFALAEAFVAVGGAATVAGTSMSVAGAVVTAAFPPLRLLTLALTGAGLAWAFFANHAETDSERAKRAIDANKVKQDQFNTSIDASIKGYEDRAAARKKNQTLEEFLGVQEASASKQRIIAIADETRMIELQTTTELNRKLALSGNSVIEKRGITDALNASKARLALIDVERDKSLASWDARLSKIKELANAEKKYEDEKAKATRTMASGSEDRPNTKGAKDSLDADITRLSKANATLQQEIKTAQQETADRQRANAEQLLKDIAVVQAKYTAADSERLQAAEKVSQAINQGTLGEGEGQSRLNQLYLDGYTLQVKSIDDTVALRAAALQKAIADENALKEVTISKMKLERDNIVQQIADAEKLAGIGKKDPENNKKVEQYQGDLLKMNEAIKTFGANSSAVDKLTLDNSKLTIADMQKKLALTEKTTLELAKQITAATKEQKIAQDASKNRANSATEIQIEAVAQAQITAELDAQAAAQAALNNMSAEDVKNKNDQARLSWEIYQAKLQTLQVDQSIKGDWLSASIKALKTYRDGLYDTAKVATDIVGGAMSQLEDMFTNLLVHGKLSFKSLADYIIAQIARIVVVQGLIQPAVNGFLGGFVGGGAGAAGSAAGGAGSLLGSIGGSALTNYAGSGLLATALGSSTAYAGAIGGGSIAAGSQAALLAAQTGEFGAAGLSLTAGAAGTSTAGGLAAGMSSALAAIPVWGWAVLASAAVASLVSSGEKRGGGQYSYSTDGTTAYDARAGITRSASGIGATFLQGPSGGEVQSTQVKGMINSAFESINSILKSVGSTATVSGFQAGLETSGVGRGGVFAGGTLSTGATFGQSGQGDNYAGTLYDKRFSTSPDDKQAVTDFGSELTLATLAALKAADLPKTIADQLKDVDLGSIAVDAATTLLNTIQTTITEINALRDALGKLPFGALKEASFDVVASLAKAAGGTSNLSTLLGNFYDKYYDDAAKAKNVTEIVGAAFVDMKQTVPATMEEFKQRVLESFKDTSVEGQALTVKLLNVSDAFAQLHAAATAADDAITKAADAFKAMGADLVSTFKAAQDGVKAAQDTLSAAMDAAQTHMDELNAAVDTAQSAVDTAVANIQSAWDSAKNKVTSAQSKLNSAMQQSAQQMTSFTKSLKDFLNTLDTTTLGSGNPESIYNANKQLYQTTAAKAAGGDTTAIGDLANVAKAFLESSKSYNATNTTFASDVESVRSGVSGVAGYTQSKSGDSTADSLDAIAQAQSELAAAQDELNKIENVAKEAGITTSTVLKDYLAEWKEANLNLIEATHNRDAFQALVGNWLPRQLDEYTKQRQLLQAILDANIALGTAWQIYAGASGAVDTVTADPNGGLGYVSSGGATAHTDPTGGGVTVTGITGHTASVGAVQDYVDALVAQNNFIGLYQFAAKEGLSSPTLAGFLHGALTAHQIDQWIKDQGLAPLPGATTDVHSTSTHGGMDTVFGGHAKGGRQDKGLAWVGEEGPELIDFGTPGRVYSSGNSAALMDGASSQRAEAAEAHNAKLALALEASNKQGEQSNALLKAVYRKLDAIDRSQRLDNSKPQQQPRAR